MRKVSTGTRTVKYAAAAIVLAAFIIGSSMYYVSLPATSTASSRTTSSSPVSGQSVLVVQLTDPPQVPLGTSSLNLTYSAVNLLVSEPASNGQVTISYVSITPLGGSASIDLLHLQNVSQTIASTNLFTGSAIYTIGFTVESVTVDINGTVHQVSLALGGTAINAILVHPVSLNGSAAALIELNPIVVNTPTGYQMIPSMVGVLKPQSEYHAGDQNVGARDQISQIDQRELNQASGQASRLIGW